MESPDHSPELRSMLADGEDVLWEGKPDRVAYILSGWAMSIPGAFFFGFACFWTFMASTPLRHGATSGVPSVFEFVFPLFGLPFIAMGFQMLVGHYLTRAFEWRNVHYMVTSDRILLMKGLRTRSLVVVPLNEVQTLDLKIASSGLGTISLMTPGTVPLGSSGSRSRSTREAPALVAVADAPRVQRIISEAMEAHTGGK